MAKIDTKTALAIAGGAALVLWAAKKTIDTIIENVVIQVGTPTLSSTPFSQGFLNVTLPVTITNNNPFPINVKYFHGVVSYGDLNLAYVNASGGFSIPIGQTETIDLTMQIPITDVFTDVLEQIQQGNIYDLLINRIYLNGNLQLQGNFTNVPIPLEDIAIPIV